MTTWQPSLISSQVRDVRMAERTRFFDRERVVGGIVALVTAGLIANMLWTREPPEPNKEQLPYLQDKYHYVLEKERLYV